MKTSQEQILDKIEERLRLIKAGNGYQNTIDRFKRERVTEFGGKDIPVCFYHGESDVKQEDEYGRNKRRLYVPITTFVRSRDYSYTDLAFQVASDIWIALNRDKTAPAVTDVVSPDLGGLVSSLSIDEITPIIGQGQSPYCGVLVIALANYFSDLYDPFTIK